MSTAERLFCAPVAGLVPITVGEANVLLVRWGHNLGPCRRPFGQEAWVLDIEGRSVAVAISASTVSEHVRCADASQLRRDEIVELARLCADPAERWATRPMLRLWREVAAPRWPFWVVVAAVAYSQSRRSGGDLYRWDGWTCEGDGKGSLGGGAWTRKRYAADEVAGPKRLWTWRYGA